VVAITVGCYLLCAFGEYVWNLILGAPKAIYARSIAEAVQQAATKQQIIEQRDKEITQLTQDKAEMRREIEALRKPVRTPAEEHRLQAAKAALERRGNQGTTILRYLRNQGKLVFGSYPPALPAGFQGEQAHELLNLLLDDELVSRTSSRHPGGYDYTYEIAPGMANVLDELLYAESSSLTPERMPGSPL
jgi:hypothetical protein